MEENTEEARASPRLAAPASISASVSWFKRQDRGRKKGDGHILGFESSCHLDFCFGRVPYLDGRRIPVERWRTCATTRRLYTFARVRTRDSIVLSIVIQGFIRPAYHLFLANRDSKNLLNN
ncbi:hypothetical protein VTK73DRAFT_6922 [Phialemonium thermophilum]|uniref:Uncharacterized protein n=1 Tax=Phialemonium thermophilum TaxID=223376 RepID=A0ABR3WHA5_9PEZI